MEDIECYLNTAKQRPLTVKFRWKIEEFLDTMEVLKSSVFPVSAAKNVGLWCLEIRKSIHGSINLGLNQESDVIISAKVKISVLGTDGKIQFSNERKCVQYPKNSGFILFPNNVYHTNTSKSELTIVCEIEIPQPTKRRYQEIVPAEYKPPPRRLAEDMGNLLSSKSLTDVTITVGERQFRAHKAILAARSPVFAAMFRNEMVEKKFNVVTITDIDPDIFQEMLEYIYTDNGISQSSRAKELLAAANKYELDRLKFMCEEALCKVLSVDNFLEIFALADCYNASYLKEYAFRFLMKNSSDVIGSTNWNKFKRTHPSLLAEMFQKLCL